MLRNIPLAVLKKTGNVAGEAHHNQISESVFVTARDSYRAVVALGEFAPEFEGKSMILADRMDGRPLRVDHLRVIVPLDKRGGRSVRDVMRIELVAAPPVPQ